MRAAFVDHQAFDAPAWRNMHPLAFSRHAALLALCRAQGWLDRAEVVSAALPERATLLRFHDANYVDALERAAESGKVTAQERIRYGFGTMENPIFPGLFDRARATVGGAIAAAEIALGGRVAFHPAGGTHHGRSDRASGFCYFNDPAFAIMTLLDAGAAPVLYLDLDAHHGDGVEDLLAGDPRVRLVSIHEDGRWPYSGTSASPGPDNAINIPVPRALNDTELDWLVTEVLARIAQRMRPAAVVITAGADCLQGDPLSAMELSNQAFWRAVECAVGWADHAVVLGGGGYNPWTVSRGWAGLWAVLSGRDPSAPPTGAASKLMAGFESDLVDEDEVDPEWLRSIADASRPGAIRAEIRAIGAAALARDANIPLGIAGKGCKGVH